MNRYKVTKTLGDGTYGSVLKAVNRATGEVVRGAVAAPACCARQGSAVHARLTHMRTLPAGGHQENEEKVLYVGGVHAAARGSGAAPAVARLPLRSCTRVGLLAGAASPRHSL